LQGFPDDFVFLGSRGDIRSQIGNAVTPPLAEAVGLEILRCLLISDGMIAGDNLSQTLPHQQLYLFAD
jgi:DNA (cytosine-5)-methyltransferase 1